MNNIIVVDLLNEEAETKGENLLSQIQNANLGEIKTPIYFANQQAFSIIPNSPFAYWVSINIRALFTQVSALEPNIAQARTGLQSLGADEVFIRTWWEVKSVELGKSARWVPFAKGGESLTWYGDVFLVTEWADNGKRQKEYATRKYNSVTRKITGLSLYFKSGITYTTYTIKGFFARVMPSDCIFSLAGSGIIPHDTRDTFWLLSILNSSLSRSLLLLMTDGRKWDPGYIKSLPILRPTAEVAGALSSLAHRAHNLQRDYFVYDETTHVFGFPGLVECCEESLALASLVLEEQALLCQEELAEVQSEIDEIVFDLYGLDEADRELVMREMGAETVGQDDKEVEDDEESEDDEETLPENMPERVQNLLMWCVGIAFGRWDVRKALDRNLLPELPGPFDPLPRCAPGALMNAESLPVQKHEVPADYPLLIAWDNVLVDDPAQENIRTSLDIVARVRSVLTLLWGDQADAIEQEICGVLDVQDLRDYFRHPTKGFFGFHIKRYSKSRRKAPIYWLLQSEKRNCAVWLYYPRMGENTLFTAENLVYEQLRREQYRLTELEEGIDPLSGSARKRREREVDKQTQLVEEISAFLKTLRELANLKLPPDHNDGVLIGIAALHELVPWKEAAKMWSKLENGNYTWSSMSQAMQRRGLVDAKED